MRYNTTDYVSILNNDIMVNALGGSQLEDLANIFDVGKAVANLSASDLTDFKNEIVVGCYNRVVARMLESKTYRFLRDTVEFGGGLQRLMASGLLSAKDSHIANLSSAHGSYYDGNFYGLPIDVKVFLQTTAKKIVYSVSDDDFAQKFNNASDVASYLGLIMTTVENSLTAQMNELSKRLVVMIICGALGDGRKVDLVTEFNTFSGLTGSNVVTYTDICADRDLLAKFSDFCKMTINRVRDYLTDINEKYNDGTVTTFTPSDKIANLFISEFANTIKYMGDPIELNAPKFSVETVSCWQTTGSSMLPSLSVTASIDLDDDDSTTETDDHTSYENVIGVIYDEDCAGITNVLTKTTVEYVGSEGFTNYHMHNLNKFYVDSRLGAVVFTLN